MMTSFTMETNLMPSLSLESVDKVDEVLLVLLLTDEVGFPLALNEAK